MATYGSFSTPPSESSRNYTFLQSSQFPNGLQYNITDPVKLKLPKNVVLYPTVERQRLIGLSLQQAETTVEWKKYLGPDEQLVSHKDGYLWPWIKVPETIDKLFYYCLNKAHLNQKWDLFSRLMGIETPKICALADFIIQKSKSQYLYSWEQKQFGEVFSYLIPIPSCDIFNLSRDREEIYLVTSWQYDYLSRNSTETQEMPRLITSFVCLYKDLSQAQKRWIRTEGRLDDLRAIGPVAD